VARRLKAADARIRVVAAEPDNAPVLSSGLAQPRDAEGWPSASHPLFRPHLMQGWSPDFVSRLSEQALAEQLVDEIVPVAGLDALRVARELATREGIFVGTSSGATLAAALTVARRAPPSSNIVCMLPDTGERYMSTPLFDGIEVDMNEAELALSRSTPGYRFDPPATPPAVQPSVEAAAPTAVASPAPAAPAVALDAAADAFHARVVAEQPVVMFALEWCEFCWAVRKLFAKLGVAFHSVDIDSVAFQADDLGNEIRAVLKARTGAPTIPQIYIGGVHVGGCTDLFDAMRAGRMQQLLDAAGVQYERELRLDPYELLPKWLHPRKSA
jgi:cysteine synthase A